MSSGYYMYPANSEKCLTPASVICLVENYFPANHAGSFQPICDGCKDNTCANGKLFEHSEQLLAKMKQQFKMFGTPSKLSDHLQVYRSFPSSHKTFENDFCEPFTNAPEIYHNHTNTETFINRKDVFAFLQSMYADIDILKHPVPQAMVAFYLKSIRTNLCNMRFIPWNKNSYLKVFQQFKNGFEEKSFRFPLSKLRTLPSSFEECLEKLKRVLPLDNIDEQQFSIIEKLLLEAFGDGCSRKVRNIGVYTIACSAAIRTLHEVIHSCELDLLDNEQSNECKHNRVLRLFVDGKNKFVLDLEMELIEEQRSVTREDGARQLTTSNEKVAMDFIARHPDVELLITPITRTPLRAVAIPNHFDNCYSVLAADLVFETISDLTFGWKAFQNCQGEEWEAVESLVEYLKTVMYLDHLEPYFENDNRKDILDKCENLFPELKEPKTLKACFWTEFSLNLQIQLVHLELDKTFPNILELAVKFKLVKPYRLVSDVVNAINRLVRFCFLEKFPILAKFIHNQKACHRVLSCDLCQRNIVRAVRRIVPKSTETCEPKLVSPTAPEEQVSDKLAQVVLTQNEEVKAEDNKTDKISDHESPSTATSGSGKKKAKKQKRRKSSKKTDPTPELEHLPQPVQNPEDVVVSEEHQGTLGGSSSSELEKLPQPAQDPEDVVVSEEQQCTLGGSSSPELEKLPQPTRSSLDSVSDKLAEEPSPRNSKPAPGANKKFLSKKDKKRIRQLTHKIELCPRKPVTDNSPPSKTCGKCLETSDLCIQKDNELKEAMKKVEELEKEVRKLNRLVDDSKIREREEKYETEIAELKGELEKCNENGKKLDELKEQMNKVKEAGKDAVRKYKEKREANKDFRRQLTSLEAENAEQKLLIDELCELQEQKSRESTLDRVLRELQSQKSRIETDDPAKKAKEMVAEIVKLSTYPELRHWAKAEFRLFNSRFAIHTVTLNSTIETLQNLTPIPDLPALPKALHKEHAEIMKNVTVGEAECFICLVDTTEGCGSCGSAVHKKCQESWNNPVCPFCAKGF